MLVPEMEQNRKRSRADIVGRTKEALTDDWNELMPLIPPEERMHVWKWLGHAMLQREYQKERKKAMEEEMQEVTRMEMVRLNSMAGQIFRNLPATELVEEWAELSRMFLLAMEAKTKLAQQQ